MCHNAKWGKSGRDGRPSREIVAVDPTDKDRGSTEKAVDPRSVRDRAPGQTDGAMFWFIRNRLVGSYRFLTWTSRS
jgi:hypothetical protein